MDRICVCGSFLTYGYPYQHYNTKKHIDYCLNNNTSFIIQTCDLCGEYYINKNHHMNKKHNVSSTSKFSFAKTTKSIKKI
jgi:hypothetical protein